MTRKKLATMAAAVAGAAALLGPAAFATSASAQNPGVASIRNCQRAFNNSMNFYAEYQRTGVVGWYYLSMSEYRWWNTNCNF